VPIYEYSCACGRALEVLAAYGAPAPTCPDCGSETRKLVSRFAIGGRSDAGPSQSQMPQTWMGTYRGNPEYVTGLRRQWDQRQRLEARYPELTDGSRPVVAHEGRYSVTPLRAGESAAPTSAADMEARAQAHHHGQTHALPHAHPDRPHRPAEDGR
jgi:putative FmdB family regulatory protein